jgi:hypothetical protein
MKKKDFALGILCSAMLFSGATAMVAGITAEPTWQNIYVDGEQVSMTAYNIAGNNYVRLRDIGQQVGFNVYWQDGVQIDTDTPYTGEAPEQVEEILPTIEEIRQEMIQRINEVRRENCVPELIVNQSLMDAAQKCSANLYTSHHNKDECLTVAACGYLHGFGSNLTILVGTGMNRIAEKAVTNWVNSPGHFQTMVDPDCDTLGVGVTIDSGRAFCYMMVGNPKAYNPYA